MNDQIVINPIQVQAYAQVLVQETKRAAEAVGDELLVGPGQQDFCACGELRSTVPWLDAELTDIHNQVIGGLNRIATAGVDAVNRAVRLNQDEAVAGTVGSPGSVATPGVSQINPVLQNPGGLTNDQLINQMMINQTTSQMFNVTMNQMSATNPFLLPEGVEELSFDSSGNMHYMSTSGYGDSTDPYSPDLDY